LMSESFRLPYTFITISLNIFDQWINALENLPILHLPPEIIVPSGIVKNNSHNYSSTS